MSAVSETIVREFLELHGFCVRQARKYVSPTRQDEDEIDFYVVNPGAVLAQAPLPFELGPADLAGVARAVVAVKGWHTETFSPGLLAHAPEILRFLDPSALRRAARALGGEESVLKILVVPALPSGDTARRQSIELLRARGLDAVISFRTMLADLITQVQVNRNYQKSDLLQVIRILKNYELLREPQLELFRPKRRAQRKD